MLWVEGYFGIALAVAVVAFVTAGLLRAERVTPPDHRGATSVIAGALWPAVLIGMAQLFILWLLSRIATMGRGSGADIAVLLTQG